MKDCPEAPEPNPTLPRDPEATREPPAIPRYGETDWYIFHFVLFTTAGVITMIVYQVINPVGSPLDTIRYIVLNVGHISGMGIAYAVALALVSKTVGSVYRRLRRLPFRSRERTTSQVTLRRGKGDGAAPRPVRATGPAPLPGHRSRRKPSGATAHRGHILPQRFSPCRQSGPCRRRCTGVP